jgi:hypothetical protein
MGYILHFYLQFKYEIFEILTMVSMRNTTFC